MSNTRPSKIPPADGGTAQSATAKAQKPAKTSVYSRRLRRLAARFNAKLTAEARDYLVACVTTTAAIQKGRSNSPADYVDEILGALEVFGPYIEKKAIPGYGPMRARYAVELLKQAVPLLDALGEHQRAERSASATHRNALSLSDQQRLVAGTAFRAVLSGDAAPEASRDAATPKSGAKRDRIESAEELAAEVARVQGEVPADLLDDAGLTADVLGALSERAGTAADTASTRNDRASARQLIRAQLAEPCGRIRVELQVLLAGARAARKVDPNVPRFTSSVLSHASASGSGTQGEPDDGKTDHNPVVAPAPKPAVG
ncbi:MAG: hypothetical protein U0326_10030 [Polyangiales bacterium]